MKRSDHYKRSAVTVNSQGKGIVESESQVYGVTKSRMLAGVLSFVVLVPSLLMGLPAESMGAEGQSKVSEVGQSEVPVSAQQSAGNLNALSLQGFLGKVMEKNNDLKVQQLEWQSNEKMVSAARGMYEPALKATAGREGNHVQNTTQQLIQRQNSEFSELNNLWNSSVEGLTPLGGTYRLGSEMKKLQNNLSSAYSGNTPDSQYTSFLGVNLTQPLLKGAGYEVTNANIQIARANADIAYEGYRQATVETVARAVQLYWQCYGAQEKLKMRQRSAAIAEEMLRLNKSRYEAGKIDYTGVLDAESGLRLRQALVAAAEQTELTAKRNLVSLFGEYNTTLSPLMVTVVDAPESAHIDADYVKSLDKAYKSYPQYLSAQMTVEREKTRMAYAKNQRLPQLDLKGSYGYNGLATDLKASLDKAIQKEYLSWSVGVELMVPLLGNIKNRNEYDAARLRQEQARYRLEMQKVELANQMEIVAGLVQRVYDQVLNYEKVVVLNAELTKAEEMRFRLGKSDIRVMFEREESYLKVRESLLDSRLAYQYALVNQYALEGTLLEHYKLSETDKNNRDFR